MSLEYYTKLWPEVQRDIEKAAAADNFLTNAKREPNFTKARNLLAHLYVKYILAMKKLDDCHDQLVHPQKRLILQRLLDLTIGRIVELKAELVKIDMDDYNFLDNILIELKLGHSDIQLNVPKYFRQDRLKLLEERKAICFELDAILKEKNFKIDYLSNFPEEEREQAWEEYMKEYEIKKKEEQLAAQRLKEFGSVEPEEKTPEEKELEWAVTMIQRHERARQARWEAEVQKRAFRLKKMNFSTRFPAGVDEERLDIPATSIQRIWKCHWERVLNMKREIRTMVFLGMFRPSYTNTSWIMRIEAAREHHRKIQRAHQTEYEEAIEECRKRVERVFGVLIKEDIEDEIRYWLEYFYRITKDLPPWYPPPDVVYPIGDIYGLPKGLDPDFIVKPPPLRLPAHIFAKSLCGVQAMQGTELVVAGHWVTPLEFRLICQKIEAQKDDKNKKKAEKPKKKTKEQLKKERLAKEKEEASGYKMGESNFIIPMEKCRLDYHTTWEGNEEDDIEEPYDLNIIMDAECYELKRELRKGIDVMMENELELLKDAQYKDRFPKKKKKRKRPKKKKPKKEKKKKDPTGDRTTEELFNELYEDGIIRLYDEAYIEEYTGERSILAYDNRLRYIDEPPGPGDVLDLIVQYGILPLGSMICHRLVPVTRSLLLLGPPGRGKSFLARMICTETAATLFDLTAGNIPQSKYAGGKGNKMLIHLIDKMSKLLQPSVILVDDIEKAFYKKVPKDEQKKNPKQVGKLLPKIVKGIKDTDQVLVLGVCGCPWLSRQGPMLKIFDKVIYVPPPDYGTYYRLWQDKLTKQHSLIRTFDCTALALTSRKYTYKTIVDLIDQVLNAERIARSRRLPYQPIDFMEELCKLEPPPDKFQDKCLKLYYKTKLMKKKRKVWRQKLLEIEKENKNKKK